MFVLFDNHWSFYSRMKKCDNVACISIVILCMILILSLCSIDINRKVYIVYVHAGNKTRTVHKNYLSVALDSSIIANNFTNFNMTDPKLINLIKALSPAYLRIGGTMADQLIFSPSSQINEIYFKNSFNILDGGLCTSSTDPECYYFRNLSNFTMSGQQWLALNSLALKTGLEIIFDLNSLLRFENGSWDFRNAKALITFSRKHNLKLNWELGNEPNSFKHHFNYDLSPEQLAKDFETLKTILNEFYPEAFLVGPDVTRPREENKESQKFLMNFLESNPPIDAITWHQYYFDGRTAKPFDFLNPSVLDVLIWQIETAKAIVDNSKVNKSMWLGETSSAYGGGAPGMSDRFLATFIWLDKLGVAAKFGVDLVIRQTIFGGSYALIKENVQPLPDWWISVLYKKLVGRDVIDCYSAPFLRVRFYCHCAKNSPGKIVVFGMNLSKKHSRIRIEGQRNLYDLESEEMKVDAYVLTSHLDSEVVYLNGVLLKLNENNELPEIKPVIVSAYPHLNLPPFSIAFWVLSIENSLLC